MVLLLLLAAIVVFIETQPNAVTNESGDPPRRSSLGFLGLDCSGPSESSGFLPEVITRESGEVVSPRQGTCPKCLMSQEGRKRRRSLLKTRPRILCSRRSRFVTEVPRDRALANRFVESPVARLSVRPARRSFTYAKSDLTTLIKRK